MDVKIRVVSPPEDATAGGQARAAGVKLHALNRTAKCNLLIIYHVTKSVRNVECDT